MDVFLNWLLEWPFPLDGIGGMIYTIVWIPISAFFCFLVSTVTPGTWQKLIFPFLMGVAPLLLILIFSLPDLISSIFYPSPYSMPFQFRALSFLRDEVAFSAVGWKGGLLGALAGSAIRWLGKKTNLIL